MATDAEAAEVEAEAETLPDAGDVVPTEVVYEPPETDEEQP